ncbi:Cell wall synthesis protein kre9 precursor [Recurvomyces mirabilis]|uniref:Cell wall synthesis protein kre9 n=1 Tax=Recurvomyces mirabilis TaxID=574656 RepID=A0AAE0WUJ2_9PEZI|nr:Cell wall synthesis protein kre9 precursor [Recurvomyces mirabilis]KAK5150193.1 Cell wall synthesis protein kre9 precursor [Recurvomyces mirabilis]
MRLSPIAILAALSQLVLADVKVTVPAAGASVPAGSITVTWTDSGVAPALSALTSYTIQLVIGGNDDSTQTPLITLANAASFSAGSSVTGTVPAGVAGSTTNGYFLKFTSVASEGGTVINYSSRFTMTGMTGTTPAAALTAVQALGGSNAGPPTVNSVNNGNAAGGAGAAAGGADFTVPYQLQTGLTKYAPMQPVPGTKITANNFTPLHPTSAYTIATTWMPKPSIATTLTASQTFSVSSMENTAAAQSNPTGDMAKFLNRWKD